MNAAQCRMARAALRLSVRDLAKLAQVATGTITRLEAGEALQARTLADIRHALEKAGVVFTNGDEPGVRLKNSLSSSLIFRAVKITIRSRLVEVLHQLFERHDRLARRRFAARAFCRSNPSFPYASADEVFLRRIQPAARLRRDNFGDDPVAVGHKDDFAGCREADVIAEPIFEVFQVNGAHAGEVATETRFVNLR